MRRSMNRRCRWLVLPCLLLLAGPAAGTADDAASPPRHRPHDGRGIHPTDPSWGAAGEPFLRLVATRYADGVSEPIGQDRRVRMPGPRLVSNAMFDQREPMPNALQASDMLWAWGQFIDHDMALTLTAEPAEELDIPIPIGDPLFDPEATGRMWIPFQRSAWDPASGTSRSNPRQQINSVTAFLDASMVYGADLERAAALRRRDATGMLRTSRGRMLPFNTRGLPNAGGNRRDLYLAGDIRANEQVGLLALHTLFVREHNRIARELRRVRPPLSGDEIYAEARDRVAALIQVITYEEFLPALLGRSPLPRYREFDPAVDPTIANVFAAAAFRVGHTMVSPTLRRTGADGLSIVEGDLPLERAFFAPEELTPRIGIEPYLRGLAAGTAQEVDTHVIDGLRNLLFGPPGAGGLDLVSLNIQRGRDHGLGSYNDTRAAFGLPRARRFADITGNAEVAAELAAMYRSPDDLEVWVGALAEDHVPGAMVGPLVRTVLIDQFARLRDGDPWWYERRFSGAILRRLRETRLVDVMRRNSDISRESVQDDVFRRP